MYVLIDYYKGTHHKSLYLFKKKNVSPEYVINFRAIIFQTLTFSVFVNEESSKNIPKIDTYQYYRYM